MVVYSYFKKICVQSYSGFLFTRSSERVRRLWECAEECNLSRPGEVILRALDSLRPGGLW